MVITYILVLTLLFYVLGASADLVVVKVKKIAETFNIGIISLGMVLGALTTLPEFFVGINSVVLNVPHLYFGNLMGGMIVELCLILGFSLILNRRVKTDGKYSSILPVSVVLLLPMFMGLRGYLNYLDGIMFLSIYLIFLYKNIIEHNHINVSEVVKNERSLVTSFFWIMFGVILMVMSSNMIVVAATRILQMYGVSALLIGLTVFSIGTNLPELVVAIRSWTRHVPELSLNHLIGSALANILVLGMMLTIKPINFEIDASYKFLLVSLTIAMTMLSLFYKSGHELTRKEGGRLLLFYLIFVFGQIFFS